MTEVVTVMTENNNKQYNDSNDNDSNDFDIEAKREQWAREREELRAEEKAQFLLKTETLLPFYTIAVLAIFIGFVFVSYDTVMDIAVNHIYHRTALRSVYLVLWFGILGDMTRLAVQQEKPLLKYCIAIIVCTVLCLCTILLTFAPLTESQLTTVFLMNKVFALAGVIAALYPVKYAWSRKRRED